MMRVLVTGGRGLVGSAVRATQPAGVSVEFAASDRADLRDAAATAALFESVRPTHVIHLAARVGGVKANIEGVGSFYHDNILINTNVLEYARQAGVSRVVSLLSSCNYPDGAPLPLKETDLHRGEPHSSNFGYAYAKRMLEVQSRAYRQQYGCDYICIIPNNLYGPDDNFDLESGHVIPAMIRKIHAAATGGPPPVLWGDGTPLREFTFSHDIAAALWWALTDCREPLLNVGTSEEVSIRQTAAMICQAIDFNPERLIWDTTKPAGQHRKPMDTTRFRAISKHVFTPLDQGIRQTVEWYAARYPNVRGVESAE